MFVVNNYPSLDNHSLSTLAITFINIVVPRLCLVRPLTIVYAHLLTHFTAIHSQGHFYPVRPLFFCRTLPGKCLKHSTPSPQRVLHSIICNRVMLQILKYRAESPPPLTPSNHEPRSRSTYGNTLDIFPSLQPLTSFATTDELELDSASMLEREG